MRTKDEIIKLLADKRIESALANSKWTDLVKVLTDATPAERSGLVGLIINRSDRGRQAGIQLQKAMLKNASERSVLEVEGMLSDDGLSLEELDALL